MNVVQLEKLLSDFEMRLTVMSEKIAALEEKLMLVFQAQAVYNPNNVSVDTKLSDFKSDSYSLPNKTVYTIPGEILVGTCPAAHEKKS